jgi:hypothetical protein
MPNLSYFRKYAKPSYYIFQYLALIILTLLSIFAIASSYSNSSLEEVHSNTLAFSNFLTYAVPIFFIFQLPLANINYAIDKKVKYYILTLGIALTYTLLDFLLLKGRAYELSGDLNGFSDANEDLHAKLELIGYVLAGIYSIFTLLNYLFFRFALNRMKAKYEKLRYLSKFFNK